MYVFLKSSDVVLFNHALLNMTTLSLGGCLHFILHFLCMSQWRSWLESIGILLFCLWNYPKLMTGFYSPLYLVTCLGSMEDCPSKALFFLPLPTAFCPHFLLTCTFWTLFFFFFYLPIKSMILGVLSIPVHNPGAYLICFFGFELTFVTACNSLSSQDAILSDNLYFHLPDHRHSQTHNIAEISYF